MKEFSQMYKLLNFAATYQTRFALFSGDRNKKYVWPEKCKEDMAAFFFFFEQPK